MGSGAGHRGPALRFAASAAGSATAPCPRWSTRRLRLACGRAAAGSVVARVEPLGRVRACHALPHAAGLCCSGCAGTDPTSTTPGPRPGPGTGPGSWTGRPRPDHLRRIDTGVVTDCPVRRPCPGPGAERREFHQDHPDHHLPDGRQPHRPPDQQPRPRRVPGGVSSRSARRRRHTRRHGTPDDTAHPTAIARAVDPLSRPPPHATPPHERARRRGRPRCRYELPSRWRRNSASMKASRSPSRTASTLPVS